MDIINSNNGSSAAIFWFFFLTLLISRCLVWPITMRPELEALDLRVDLNSTSMASTDFGKQISYPPTAVLYPSSVIDIATLIRFSYTAPLPFAIAAKGHAHSLHGQAQAHRGVVIEMSSLDDKTPGLEKVVEPARIGNVTTTSSYADVGGEQLWIEVLHATLNHGLAPKSWTDYLYLTVGGTLSNAGISGQAFRHGPQISNVYEMEIVTESGHGGLWWCRYPAKLKPCQNTQLLNMVFTLHGRGEIVTCSRTVNSDLFFAVLGGLGQFGIVTRARIALEPAPRMVRWIRVLYSDFSAFTRDQEYLISLGETQEAFNYIEGFVIVDEGLISNWRSSFSSPSNPWKISRLPSQHQQQLLYCLEVAKYYDYYNDDEAVDIDEEVDLLLKRLNFIPGFVFTTDISYVEFLNRVHEGELTLRSKGLWDVPHPWLNLLVPASRISDFDDGVFKKIIQQNKTMGPILVYPLNRNKWDEKMFAVIPDEQVFYSIGILRSAIHDWEYLLEQNQKILNFCDEVGIDYKLYLPHYKTEAEWKKHFGPKWNIFLERKKKFDPKAILAPGHGIFPSSLTRIGSIVLEKRIALRSVFSKSVAAIKSLKSSSSLNKFQNTMNMMKNII